MITKNNLLDYLQGRVRPSCVMSPPKQGHFSVTCGGCTVIVPDDDELTTTTANEIERRLEPCLGRNWMP